MRGKRISAPLIMERWLATYFPKTPPLSGSQLVSNLKGLEWWEGVWLWRMHRHEGYWFLLRLGSIGGEELRWTADDLEAYSYVWETLYHQLLWVLPSEGLFYYPKEIITDSEEDEE